jgi:hypothetical protein
VDQVPAIPMRVDSFGKPIRRDEHVRTERAVEHRDNSVGLRAVLEKRRLAFDPKSQAAFHNCS